MAGRFRKRARAFSQMLLVATLTVSCGGDSTGPDDPGGGGPVLRLSDLVGSWIAVSSVHTNGANPGQTFDIVANGGELRATVLSDGRTRTWVTLGAFNDEWDHLLTLSGNQLTSTPAEAGRPVRRYTAVIANNQLTLTSTDASFDFTLTGAAPVPSNEVTVLVRH